MSRRLVFGASNFFICKLSGSCITEITQNMDAEAQWARGMVHLPESDQTNDNEWLGTDRTF